MGDQALHAPPTVAGPVHAGSVRLPGDPQSVGVVRAWLAGLLGEAGTEAECIELAVLVASELASNAVRHGSGDVLCHAVVDRETCTLTVFDFGGGTPAVVERERETIGGLGLVIVERLSRAWGVTPFAGGKAVYALLDADRSTDDQGAARALA